MTDRPDYAETTVRRRKLYPLPNGKQVEIRALGLNDYVQAREEALAQFKRQRLQTWTRNVDLLPDDAGETKQQLLRDAFERAEQITIDSLPTKQMQLPVRLPSGQFRRDGRGQVVTELQTVDYTAWWMSDTPEGRLFMTWLSIRRSDPAFTMQDADEIFRDHFAELERIADEVGEISGGSLGNSSSPSPETGNSEQATPMTRRQQRKARRRIGR